MDPTCDPALSSFLKVAPESHFPIQNLPFGVFRRSPGATPRVGVAIGDWILDLAVLAQENLLACESLPADFFLHQQNLNAFLAQGRRAWRSIRARVSQLLRHD